MADILKTALCEVWLYDKNTLSIIIKKPRMANKLNRLLKYYDATIREGEEPMFRFDKSLVPNVEAILSYPSGIIGKHLV